MPPMHPCRADELETAQFLAAELQAQSAQGRLEVVGARAAEAAAFEERDLAVAVLDAARAETVKAQATAERHHEVRGG